MMFFARVDTGPEEPYPPLCGRCGHWRLVVVRRAGAGLRSVCERCGAECAHVQDVEHVPPFGERLRAMRAGQGLTLHQLASRAHLYHGYLAQLERGERGMPTAQTLRKLAAALGVSVSVLRPQDREA
jgi:DNA-binding XRE family transcriptional regulator